MKDVSPHRPFRLGTRASPLALAQAELARRALIGTHGWRDDAVVLVPMIASGDRIQDRALADIGGKALWTRELDRALAAGAIDAAVHSMKDVETIRPDVFAIAAMLRRGDVRDRLVGADSIAALPVGARVGTSSPRRSAQLLHRRPDLAIVLLRGNVGTRLARIAEGAADATLLAAAGLDRLGLTTTGAAIATAELLPAPAQGAVGIEIRADDAAARAAVTAIDDAATSAAVGAERALLAALGGNCHSPIAALARHDGDRALWLDAELLASDGSARVTGRARIERSDDAAALAASLLDRAPPLIRALFGR